MLFVFLGKGAHLTDFMENSGNCQRDKWKLDMASYVYIFNSHSCYSCMHCMRESMESNSWKFVMGISLSKTPIKLAKPLHNMPPLQELKIQHSTHFSFQNKPWQETFSVNTCACMWKSDVHAIPGEGGTITQERPSPPRPGWSYILLADGRPTDPFFPIYLPTFRRRLWATRRRGLHEVLLSLAAFEVHFDG